MSFTNRRLADFSEPINGALARGGITLFHDLFAGKTYPHILGGESLFASRRFHSFDPNTPDDMLGSFQYFEPSTMVTDEQMERIHDAHIRFSVLPLRVRIQIAQTMARLINERYWMYVGALVCEVGKSFAEADGEVAEAEDFARYDAQLAANDFALAPEATLPGVSEFNAVRPVPHGTFLITIPYNFPFAIGLDMALKALLAGNAIILSPSDKAATVGWMLYRLFDDALAICGIPNNGLVNFAPGTALDRHATVHALLGHSVVSGLCFTGSSAVFDSLETRYGNLRRWNGGTLRIGAAETSGVNALYVDKSADIKLAARAVMQSFLGISGQKCSSVRRVIAHQDIADLLFTEVVRLVDHVSYGDTKKGNVLGALIGLEHKKTLDDRIAEFSALSIAQVAYVKTINERVPSDFAPRILRASADILSDESKLFRLGNTEFFGPVCTFISVSDFTEAERVFNASPFALTGGIISQVEAQITHAIMHFRAGNFYVNRKITGAYVGSEQFGGLVSRSAESGIPTGPHALAFYYSIKTISGNFPKGAKTDVSFSERSFYQTMSLHMTFAKH